MMRTLASFSILAVLFFVSNRLFLKGIASEHVTQSEAVKVKSFVSMNDDERIKAWWGYTETLPTCRYSPEACEVTTLTSKLSLVAGAKMRYDALGIGGAPLSIIVLVCTSVGIFFSERTGKPVKQKIDKSEKADDVEEGTALITPSPSSAPATLMHGRLLENGAIYFKACVALLLLIELNDLMAPNAPILATPELAELIQSMPNSESTTGLRAEQLVAIRTCLLASWFTFFLLPSRKVSLSGISFSAGAIAYLFFYMAGSKHSPSSSSVIEMVCVGCLLLITLYTVCCRRRARGLNHGLVVGSSGKKEFENAKKLPLEERLELAREGPTLIFDGICNLCNGSMSWFQERCREDSPVWYMWAQHQDTHEFLDEVGITRQDILKSWAYIESGIVYRGSTAWLMALGNLRAPWCYLSAVGKLCPTFIRETVYNFVAANRYNALGHSEACQRPNPAMRARFLHNTVVRGEQDTEIPSSQRKRLLVIGCGPAGLFVAKKLANKRGGAFSVVVVEPKEYYEFTPGILRGMCDPSNMNDLTFKLEPVLCDDLGITFVQGVATDLNSRQATVKRVHGGVLRRSGPDANRDDFLINSSEDVNTVHVDFDFCVVAAGSQYATSSLWKVQTNLKKETSLTSNSYYLEGRIEELSKEHARLKQLNERRSGCVSIMGAGLVGVELAGEIRHHFPDIRQVKLFDPMPTVLPPLADSAQTIATKWLQNHNVELVLGDNFSKESVAAAERDSDVVYRCVGVQTRAGFLPQEVLDERGQVRVNSAMQIVRDGPTNFGAGRIFAIGDCVAVEGAATPYVKDIYPAEAMAGVVVENIRRALIVQCIQTRPGILKEIKPLMVMNLCSLGPRDCIFTLNRWVIARGLPATFVKWMIQYTKMSDSRNEILGRIIWNLIPH